ARWGWSRSRVQRFLARLQDEEMLEEVANSFRTETDPPSGTPSGTPTGTVYRIVNYATYAVLGETERDTPRDTERDTSGTRAGQREPLNHSTIGRRARK